nr:immunoglobulin heavy chain junction region [Mus musculus]NSM07795.1 immunoglobulin heavy chain junction region [Mus musculus]
CTRYYYGRGYYAMDYW